MKYLAVVLLLASLSFAQKVTFRVKVQDNKIRLVPFLPVEVEVKPIGNSPVPQNHETVTCKMRSQEIVKVKSESYRVTYFECGDMKLEVKSWVLSAQ